MATIKKVYFFCIINCDVDVNKEYDPYSGSNDAYLSFSGTEVIRKSEYYSSIEDALDSLDVLKDEKHYEYSPVMEGWVRE